jgi:hypothetical protein
VTLASGRVASVARRAPAAKPPDSAPRGRTAAAVA